MILSSEKMRSDNKLRSIFFVLWQALIPGLIIWLLLDPQLNLLKLNFKDSIAFGYMFLIGGGMLLYSFITTLVCFLCGYHQQEQFIYSIIVMLEFVVLYLTSLWLLSVFWRFIIAISLAILGTLVMTIIVMTITNYFYKD
ncbi:DxFTY motif-containing membrane protein [Spiroplasma endosymbiont of Agriotes lineatus]|uniref:DxFTY motif-containing membrane protein n=1 Tax=Spiroplasma endosymbiont of Agriotes lineatus TaxID=3077930 RepID=UPI0030CAE50F